MKKQLLLPTIAILMAFFTLNAQVTPTVYADGFSGLIGINFDEEGNLWATEQGSGNDDARITIVAPDGTKTVFMTGLPSTYIQAAGETVGAHRTYQLPDNKVLIIVGEGSHPMSESLMIVDKSTFTPGTPLTLANVVQTISHGAFIHAQGFVQSNPFNVTWDAEDNLFISDSGANSIVKWDKTTGSFSIVKTIDRFPNPLPFGPPMIDPVPTKVLAKPDGTFHVCQLTGFPFIEGAANVYNLDAAGNLSVHESGFTCLTDMAFDPNDGNLCVMQFGVFGPVDSTLNFILGTAAVIKLLPDGTRDTIAQGIGGLAPSFTFDAAGNLYVADLVFGQVLKYELVNGTNETPLVQTRVKAYPNPTTNEVTIAWELTRTAPVTVEVFDLTGQRIAQFNEGTQGPGTYSVRWDGTNANGQKAGSGMYVYRLTAGRSLTGGLLQVIR